MNYKEIFQQAYDELEESLGREPDWKEAYEAYQDKIGSMVDAIMDRCKYGE